MDSHWIEAEGVLGSEWEKQLEGYDGILVPGGFGKRGIEGMINSIRYARERKVPYFGICLGMQTTAIEYARNVRGLQARIDRVQPRHAIPGVIFSFARRRAWMSWACTMRPEEAGRASWRKPASLTAPGRHP